MALTTSSASSFLQYLSGGSGSISAPSVYIALGWNDGTLSPNNTQGFKEISGAASYARALLGNNSIKHMDTPTYDTSEGVEKTTNKDIIYFNEATEPWYPGGDSSHQVTTFALYSAATGGTMYAYGTLTTPVTIQTDYVPLFRTGNLTLTMI